MRGGPTLNCGKRIVLECSKEFYWSSKVAVVDFFLKPVKLARFPISGMISLLLNVTCIQLDSCWLLPVCSHKNHSKVPESGIRNLLHGWSG